MAVIGCPGCGLPRQADQVGVAPCPVCHAPAVSVAVARPATAREPDPTAGLPADASQLETLAPPPGAAFGSAWAAVLVFAAGAAAGVGGLVAWQAAFPAAEPASPQLAAAGEPPPIPDHVRPAPAPPAVPVAPMPHEPRPPEPERAPEPRAARVPPPPNRLTVITLNEPNLSFALPPTAKNSEHVVLKGRVKALRVSSLGDGDVVDASELWVETISIGKVSGGAVLKVNCPNGTVAVTQATEGKAVVEIHAPGGDVKFSLPTIGVKPGSKIDGGATVTVTARTVEFRGDIAGDGTRVTVNLEKLGGLKVASVSGKAVVEYRHPPHKTGPEVVVGAVAPTAVFRKVE